MHHDRIDDDQLEFQLKIHTLFRFLQSKTHEVQIYAQALQRLPNFAKDQKQLFTILNQVKVSVKGMQRMFGELRKTFHDLQLTYVLDFFQQMMLFLIKSVQVLANSSLQGIESSFINFSSQKKPEHETIAMKLTEQQILKQLEMNNGRSNDFYSDLKNQREIQRIYNSLLIDKHSVAGVTSSLAPSKLNQIEEYFTELANETDKIIEQGLTHRKQQRNQPNNLIYSSQQFNRMFKAEISDGIKKSFQRNMMKLTNKIQTDFYHKQYNKLKTQILKLKVQTNNQTAQTQVEYPKKQGINLKERKTIDRLHKEIRGIEKQRDQIIDKYLQLKKQSNKRDSSEDRPSKMPSKITKRQSISVPHEETKTRKVRESRLSRKHEQFKHNQIEASKKQIQSQILIQFGDRDKIKKKSEMNHTAFYNEKFNDREKKKSQKIRVYRPQHTQQETVCKSSRIKIGSKRNMTDTVTFTQSQFINEGLCLHTISPKIESIVAKSKNKKNDHNRQIFDIIFTIVNKNKKDMSNSSVIKEPEIQAKNQKEDGQIIQQYLKQTVDKMLMGSQCLSNSRQKHEITQQNNQSQKQAILASLLPKRISQNYDIKCNVLDKPKLKHNSSDSSEQENSDRVGQLSEKSQSESQSENQDVRQLKKHRISGTRKINFDTFLKNKQKNSNHKSINENTKDKNWKKQKIELSSTQRAPLSASNQYINPNESLIQDRFDKFKGDLSKKNRFQQKYLDKKIYTDNSVYSKYKNSTRNQDSMIQTKIELSNKIADTSPFLIKINSFDKYREHQPVAPIINNKLQIYVDELMQIIQRQMPKFYSYFVCQESSFKQKLIKMFKFSRKLGNNRLL